MVFYVSVPFISLPPLRVQVLVFGGAYYYLLSIWSGEGVQWGMFFLGAKLILNAVIWEMCGATTLLFMLLCGGASRGEGVR